MKLPRVSVIIVNFNVEHFLALCLESVFASVKNLDAEIIVVDNHSSDRSVEMVRQRFPNCILIENQENIGFSRANNVGINISAGKYVLLLNPDTVLPEDGLEKAVSYLELHPDVGGLGLRMIDGSGIFLPESRRGLPTPWVSFCKAFGLNWIFPKSPLFGGYYQSYIPENQIHETDILSGASMMMRRETLEKTGNLDEAFFMYGEDVDLSYRIQKAGYRNVYFPDTTIIHFKGESTRRGSLSFVFHFYRSMLLFSQKHFNNHAAFRIFIFCGVLARAFLALLQRFFRNFGGGIIEFCAAFAGMVYIKNWWELNFKGVPGMYPDAFIEMLVPAYILVWLTSIRLIGRYSRNYDYSAIIKGIALGTIIISGITNFFDDYRFSKGLILIGSVWTFLIAIFRHALWQWIQSGTAKIKWPRRKRLLVVGGDSDFLACKELLKHLEGQIIICGLLSQNKEKKDSIPHLGSLEDLHRIIHRLGIDEIVLSVDHLSRKKCIALMEIFAGQGVKLALLPASQSFIIASTEKHNQGIIFQADNIPAIIKPYKLRLKRLADLFSCGLLVFLFPFAILQGVNFISLVSNWFSVLSGEKSWVGLAGSHLNSFGLKSGVISMSDLAGTDADARLLHSMDHIYAEEYHPLEDIWILLKNLKFIGKV